MFRSLQVQILLVIASLVLILLMQAVFSRLIEGQLIDNQRLASKSVTDVDLMHQLEHDVIDLQCNVLIYKGAASDSAV
ncbi:MAG: hypothetical protein ACJA0N_001115 [Pseudohongiellaceae bacterium]|jgi:hypothetical protein